MTTANDNPRPRAEQTLLAFHSRAIGPAAILAALLFTPKARIRHSVPVRQVA